MQIHNAYINAMRYTCVDLARTLPSWVHIKKHNVLNYALYINISSHIMNTMF